MLKYAIRSLKISAHLIMMAMMINVGTLAAKEYRIAVVKDGPSSDEAQIGQIERELNLMLSQKDKVIFVTDENFDAGWQKGHYRQVLQNALQDRSIDMILGWGVLVTQEAAREDIALTKPFISGTLLNGRIPKLQYSEQDHSLKKNLVVMIQPQDAQNDLEVFSSIRKIDRLHVGIGREIFENLPDVNDYFRHFSAATGIETIPVAVDAANPLKGFPDSLQAVYLVSIPRMNKEQRRAFITELNERKIPTISALGPDDLALGALATNRRDVKQEIVRRCALNFFNLIDGTSPAELPVFLISNPRLQINARTAVAIGYRPNVEARVSASFMYPEAFEEASQPLSLERVVELAMGNNKKLRISRAQKEFAGKSKNFNRGSMLPRIDIGGSYTYYDLPAVGIILPEQWMQMNVKMRQMIYDDRLISDYRSASRQAQAAEFLDYSTQLDVVQNAEYQFLIYAQAGLIHDIQVSNLKLTEGNLDIARMRVEVGQAGQDEVYRWQAELANRKASVLSTESMLENQRIAMNQALGIGQDSRWQPVEIPTDVERFSWLNGAFENIFQTAESTERFTGAVLQYTLQEAPEINVYLQEKEAQEITLGQRKRSFYLPSLSAEISYGNNLAQEPAQPELGDYTLQAGVNASLPLFEGTRKIYDMQRQRSRLNELDAQLAQMRELVEKRLRSAVQNLQASFPNMKYSAQAAENARLNFEVVREKYASGIVNITDLLEAQTTSLKADIQAVSARYNYLIDVIELQRASAFFPEMKNETQIKEFVDAIKEKMAK